MKRDTLHDYRPDPQFEIKSNLSESVAHSADDSAISACYPEPRILDAFHKEFCETSLADINAEIAPWNTNAGWAALPLAEKITAIKGLGWEPLLAVVRKHCDETLNKSFAQVVPAPIKIVVTTQLDGKDVKVTHKVTRLLEEYREIRPYVEAMYRLCPNWFHIKDYFHDGKAIRLSNGETVEPRGDLKKVMVAFVAFRNFYVNGMFNDLRKHLTITHKMVGSIELNSDYDVTFGGPDDVKAAAEFHRAFANAWGVESAVLFDTNVYYRDWMTVIDQNLLPSRRADENNDGDPQWKNRRSDPSIQVQVLDFIGDLYSLVKIRRYTTPIEWAALTEAAKRGVEVPGLDNPFYSVDATAGKDLVDQPSGSSEIPRFRRFELVDPLFRIQFVLPLLRRIQDVRDNWEQSAQARALREAGAIPEDPAELLHLLMEYDKNAVLRAMRIAYIELGAKLRAEEEAVKKEYPGEFAWRQNDDWGAVIEVKTPWSLQGMLAFLERSSLLLSEAVLFANEAYNTQGSLWTVVGGQGGTTPENLSLEHYLQSFNEQVGDALKELQKYLAEFEEAMKEGLEEAGVRLGTAVENLEAAEKALMAAADNPIALGPAQAMHLAALKEMEESWAAFTTAQNGTPESQGHNITGMFRASKYEGRLREMLQSILDALTNDPAVRRRIEIMRRMFPHERSNADSQDLMLLTKESLMAGFYDKYVQQLIAIRKGRDSFFDYRPRLLRELDWERIRADLGKNLQLSREAQKTLDAMKNLNLPADELKAAMKNLVTAYNDYTAALRARTKIEIAGKPTEKAAEIIKNALTDPNFKAFRENTERDVAKIVYGARGAQLQSDPANPTWGLRELIHHLLWHCALVNQLYRKIRSRGPVDLSVRNFSE